MAYQEMSGYSGWQNDYEIDHICSPYNTVCEMQGYKVILQDKNTKCNKKEQQYRITANEGKEGPL